MRGGDVDVMPSLGLFGHVAWHRDRQENRLPTGRPTSLALLLAEHHPRPLSAEAILDRLWEQAPESGANAVQRHVSALRRSLRAAGYSPEAIQTLPSGYRLHPAVRTDLSRLDDLLDAPDAAIPDPRSGGGDVAWWLAPLPDAPWEPHVLFRMALGRRAVELARRWAARARDDGRVDEVVATLRAMTELHPDDEILWSAYTDALVATGDRQLVAATHTRMASVTSTHQAPPTRAVPAIPDRGSVPSNGLADLRGCVARWSEGDGDGAFEELDRVGRRLEADVARRVARSLVWTGPEDGYASLLWHHLVTLASVWPQRADGLLVSLDAYSLEQMHDGVEVADGEVDASTTVDELVQALRVRFLVGLGRPLDDRQRETVDRLASMAHGVAQAECRRFRAILDVKQGRFLAAQRQLDAYEAVASRAWPGPLGDDASLAREVLTAYEVGQVGDGGRTPTVAPLLLNQLTLDASALWHRLVQGNAPQDPRVVGLYHRVRGVVPPRLGQAVEALRQVLLCGLSGALLEVDVLKSVGPTGPRDVQAASAALAEVALRTGRDDLAREAFDRLEPWASEHLGVWPLQLVIGPTDHHLERLGALAA